MNDFKPVILETPYAGDIKKNLRFLRQCMRACIMQGEAPYASHALYTQPGVLNDEDPDERLLGISAGFAFRSLAQYTVVYIDNGISYGMSMGIEHARSIGQQIEFRKLEDDLNYKD